MRNTTEISWTHWPATAGRTWNPTRGCSRVSPGCGGAKGVGGCYAERQAYRFSGPGGAYEGLVQLGKQGPRWTGLVPLVVDKLSDPLRWRTRSTVFVNSMSDLFHESLSNESIAAVFGVMAACQDHTFIVLTKRAERLRRWFAWVEADGVPGDHVVSTCASNFIDIDQLQTPWPLPNVVLGVSVENQEWAEKRIPFLLGAPAACRMVSYEPALGPVRFIDWLGPLSDGVPGLDWVVLGGESGPGARPFEVEWARSTIRECQTAKVPVFVKQLGALPVADLAPTGNFRTHDGRRQMEMRATTLSLSDRKGSHIAEWPADLRIRELPAISRRHLLAMCSSRASQRHQPMGRA